MQMLTYSVAIRTLGLGGDIFRRELEEIAAQTVQPDRVLVYIAEGAPLPEYRIGKEEYVWVGRGMMSQRLRRYDEIGSDCILMLDDDVSLQPDSVAAMLTALAENDADCVGADTFGMHERPLAAKIYAALTNFVFPHCDDRWAFKIRRNGSFSYNRSPKAGFLLSQSCAGNAMLWRKSTYDKLRFEDELWLDEFAFAYGDDMLESYKVHKNGFRLGVVYDSGIVHLDARSASGGFRKSPEWIYTRTKVGFLIWWRSCYRTGGNTACERFAAAFSFFCKSAWQLLGITAVSLSGFSFGMVVSYLKGLRDGRRYARLDGFGNSGPYII
ncbi:MAG: glycosyltransferase [Alistipes sp.]|nr:glycosyltransferase [Alistipes sp.]